MRGADCFPGPLDLERVKKLLGWPHWDAYAGFEENIWQGSSTLCSLHGTGHKEDPCGGRTGKRCSVASAEYKHNEAGCFHGSPWAIAATRPSQRFMHLDGGSQMSYQ